MMLLPLDGSGVTPAGALASDVFGEHAVPAATLKHVLLVKIFSTPVTTFGPRFVANVANATIGPDVQAVVFVAEQLSPMLGLSLKPFAGVWPSTVDASAVRGVHVPCVIKFV